MRTASADYIAVATTDYAKYYGKFTVGETEYTTPLTDLKVTATENGGSDLTIGNAQASSVSFSIYDDTLDLENREMTLYEGVETADDVIEYIQIGIFKIVKATAEDGKTSYNGYDRMYSTMEMMYVSKLSYPNKDINVIKEICSQAGIVFDESTMSDTSISIATKPDGYTRREMLGYLAARQGKNAVINSQGELELRWYKAVDYTIRPSKYYENGVKLTTSKNFKVEKIVCEVETSNDSKTLTSGTGSMAINISNPFMTQAVLDSVFKRIGGFTYRPLTVECLGDWRLEVGDIIKVTKDSVTYSVPITSITYDCDGGLKCSIESTGQSDTNNVINPTGPVTSQLQRMTAELITANQVIATKLTAEEADIKYATITSLNALSGKFDDLNAKAITTDNLAAETAKLGYMSAEEADIKYANIQLTNIDTANVATLFANVGLIDRATVVEGHITGFLDSVEVNANKITAGTLIADRILLKGSTSGLLYALNNLGELTSATIDTLDGYILTDRTIEADKIVAKSITANELDVENIFANNAVLSTLTSQQAFINAISTNSVVVGATKSIKEITDNIYTTGTTTIDGGKITTGSITADKISVDDLSAITATIGSWSITTNKIYAGNADTGTAVMQRPTANTTWVFAAGGKNHSNYSDCPFRVDKAGNLYSTSGTIGGFSIGSDYLRTKTDSRGYKFGLSSNIQPTGICSYIGKEGSDTDYVYAVHWNGEVEASKITAGGAVFGGARVYFNVSEPAYLTKGDKVPIVLSTGGYITSSGTSLCFFVPTRQIIGATSAKFTFTSGQGVKVRQSGKYAYGSSANTNVTPTSQSISVNGEAGVKVIFTMANSTNASNNDACGVTINGTLTLS